MIFPRLELEPYSYQKHTLPIKLKNLNIKTINNFYNIYLSDYYDSNIISPLPKRGA